AQLVGPLGQERPVGALLKQIPQVIRAAVAHFEGGQAELVVGADDITRANSVEADVDRRPVAGEDDPEQQVVDAVERSAAAVDINVVEVFPAGQGGDETAQTEDVVQMGGGQ